MKHWNLLNIESTTRIYILFSLFFIYYIPAFSQGVCQTLPLGSELGNFEIKGGNTVGCSPFLVELKDNSGGINVRYDFYYSGQSADKLDKIGNLDKSNAYFSSNAIKVFTILQYGEKNGKPMYACKTISVLPNNKPKYSYSICSSQLEIAIPKATENNFDYYKVNWGSGNAEETVQENQLPFSGSKAVTYPTQIKVEGYFNATQVNSCNTNNAITIDKLNAVNYPNGYALPFDPNIDELTMLNAKELVLKFRGSEDPNGYNLNMREFSGVYTSNAFKTNVKPGNIAVTLADSTKSYCFYFTRVSGCGSFEESAEVCSVLQNPLAYSSGNIDLSWSSYPDKIRDYTTQTGFHSFNKKITIEKEFNNAKNTIDIGSNSNNYTDKVTCAKSLRYRIKTEISGLLLGFQFHSIIYSNWQVADINKIKASPITDLYVTVNDKNQIELIYKNNSNWNTLAEKFYLFEMINNTTLLLDSSLVEVPFNVINRDAAKESYCFKLGYKDICGFYSELSSEVCNLSLSFDESNTLKWEPANPFSISPIGNLEIESKKEDLELFNLFDDIVDDILSYNPDFKTFEDKAYFKLKAVDAANSKVSYSNSIEIPLRIGYYLPSVFTPNGDGKNDDFYLLGRTEKITSYAMKIYNRWGELIFTSNNPKDAWTGQTKTGTILPSGTYFCYVMIQDEKPKPNYIKNEVLLLH